MSYISKKPLKHTDYNNHLVHQTAFKGIKIQNQPNHSIYTPIPTKKFWFQHGTLATLSGITAYLHFGNKVGFGLGDKDVNWNTVPRIIDRSSPYFWF
jgi:hypothetical protein